MFARDLAKERVIWCYLSDTEDDLLEVSVPEELSLELVVCAEADELPRLCLGLGLPPLGW